MVLNCLLHNFYEDNAWMMHAWMLSNKLKLDRDKSEVLVISSIYRPRPTLSSVDICNETVLCSRSARNIGVILDQSLSMKPHINALCKSSFYQLHNIGLIRECLTPDSDKIIVQALLFLNLITVTHYYMVFLLILFKNYNTFRTQQPVSPPNLQDSAILLLSLEIFIGYQFTFA